jgi:NAD(P)-dependent dehydrogenase (short-subunit alcohol dehydrogenase family)
MKKLVNKKILITGASQGLGRTLALAFAGEDATAICLTARTRKDLDKVALEIRKINPSTQVLVVAADLSSTDDVERIVATTLEAFSGRIDVLVNNASAIGPTPLPYLLDYPPEDFTRVLKTNLVAPFLMIRSVLSSMIEYGGSIINVTSDAGVIGYPGWGAYGISKFGLEGMSQTWASELQDTSVRVNWVDPGSMNTSMHRAAEPDEDPDQWADPSSVTDVFVYLASDDSASVSGKRFQAQEIWKEIIKKRHHA